MDLTGQIFNFPPNGVTGTKALQIYQAGNSDRNTIVTYSSNTSVILNEEDCVRVIGNNRGSIEFSNMFGGTVVSVLIDADSVEKVTAAALLILQTR